MSWIRRALALGAIAGSGACAVAQPVLVTQVIADGDAFPISGAWTKVAENSYRLAEGRRCRLHVWFEAAPADPDGWDSFVADVRPGGEQLARDVLYHNACPARLYSEVMPGSVVVNTLLFRVGERSFSVSSVARGLGVDEAAQMTMRVGREMQEYYAWSSNSCGCRKPDEPAEASRCDPGTPAEAYEQVAERMTPEAEARLKEVLRTGKLAGELHFGAVAWIRDSWIAYGLLGRRLLLAGALDDDEAAWLILLGYGRYLEGETLDERQLVELRR